MRIIDRASDGKGTAQEPPPPTPPVKAEIDEPPRPRYLRRPEDLLHLFAALALLAMGAVIAVTFSDEVAEFESKVHATFGNPTRPSPGFTIRFVSAFITAGVFVALVATRRFRIALYLVLAFVLATASANGASTLLEHLEPAWFAQRERELAATDRWSISAVGFLAVVTAIATVVSPSLTSRWRRVAWFGLALAIVARILFSSVLPFTIVFEIAIGLVVGAGILLLFGAPNPQPTGAAAAKALAGAGFPLASLRAANVDARGSIPYLATTTAGQRMFVKVMGSGQSSADLLFRIYRQVRFRDIGDQSPFCSLRREVEHEAFLTLASRDAGVRTPRPFTVTEVEAPGSAMLLALECLDGRSLDSAPPETLDDRLLDEIWGQVALLRQRRIAHRDLRLANVFVDDAGEPWIIDFGFSELAVESHILADDVAGLLASTALVVGPDRAVAAAAKVLDPEPLAEALPRLQPDALSRATAKALAKHKGLLGDLRTTTQQAAHVDEVKFEKLARVRPKTLLALLVVAGGFYFLYPQLTDAGRVWGHIRNMNPAWAVAAVAASAFSYVGATLSMLGAVPRFLRPLRTLLAQLASSFTNRITPASAGGYAVNIRFLQKAGVETPVAVTAVGVNSLAGLPTHLFLTVIFAVWAGSSWTKSVKLPSTKVLLYVAVALLLSVGVIVVVPVVRRLVIQKVWPIVHHGLSGLVATARNPTKLLLLLGGSLLVTTSYLLCLAASVEAFAGGASFAKVGFAYLTAAMVTAAAPTPGGIGVAEATYTVGLTLVGVPEALALSAVFLFRLCTYWLPILPGWLSLRSLRKHGQL